MVFISQMPRSVFEETKYLEIVIVIDHSMVRESNSVSLYGFIKMHINKRTLFLFFVLVV